MFLLISLYNIRKYLKRDQTTEVDKIAMMLHGFIFSIYTVSIIIPPTIKILENSGVIKSDKFKQAEYVSAAIANSFCFISQVFLVVIFWQLGKRD